MKTYWQVIEEDRKKREAERERARTAAFRADADSREDAIRERITINQGHRLGAAVVAAEASGTEAERLEQRPNLGGAVWDPSSTYLIHGPKASTADEDALEIDALPDRLELAAKRKARCLAMASHLEERHPEVAAKLRTCNTYRVIRHWLETGDARLIAAKTCKNFKLCPVCASLRSGRMAARYTAKVVRVMTENPDLTPWFWTFTVRDGANLGERLSHLRRCWKLLIDTRRKVRSGTSRNSWMPFAATHGGVYSIEIKRGKRSGLWHPHAHAFTLCDRDPGHWGTRNQEMEAWWLDRTGDSFIVDCRPVEDLGGSLLEVLKYPLKFGDLSLDDTEHAWRVTSLGDKPMQLTRAFGSLRGVPEPRNLLDELSDDEGAFEDLLFVFDHDTDTFRRRHRHVEELA